MLSEVVVFACELILYIDLDFDGWVHLSSSNYGLPRKYFFSDLLNRPILVEWMIQWWTSLHVKKSFHNYAGSTLGLGAQLTYCILRLFRAWSCFVFLINHEADSSGLEEKCVLIRHHSLTHRLMNDELISTIEIFSKILNRSLQNLSWRNISSVQNVGVQIFNYTILCYP